MATRLFHSQYTAAWICTTPLAIAAAKVLLDETHEDLPVHPNDNNGYILGSMGKHNVVIACLASNEFGTITRLRTSHRLKGSLVLQFLETLHKKYPETSISFSRPDVEDLLFESAYEHVTSAESCQLCDRNEVIFRPERENVEPVVHYGPIASGNSVIESSAVRDCLSHEPGAHCVETEAAGLMNHFPCLVIRGICDYADSHKNNAWERYASVVVVTYAKALLLEASMADGPVAPLACESPAGQNIVSHVGLNPPVHSTTTAISLVPGHGASVSYGDSGLSSLDSKKRGWPLSLTVVGRYIVVHPLDALERACAKETHIK